VASRTVRTNSVDYNIVSVTFNRWCRLLTETIEGIVLKRSGGSEPVVPIKAEDLLVSTSLHCMHDSSEIFFVEECNSVTVTVTQWHTAKSCWNFCMF